MGAIFLIVFEHSFTMIGRIIVANRFVGYLNIKNKNKHTCVHGLILGGKTRRGDNLTTIFLIVFEHGFTMIGQIIVANRLF